MARYISGGNFPGGNFPGGSLMGGNFPGGNFPRTIKSVYYCSETISYYDPKYGIYSLKTLKIQEMFNNLVSFKSKIKFWKPENPHRLGKPR